MMTVEEKEGVGNLRDTENEKWGKAWGGDGRYLEGVACLDSCCQGVAVTVGEEE